MINLYWNKLIHAAGCPDMHDFLYFPPLLSTGIGGITGCIRHGAHDPVGTRMWAENSDHNLKSSTVQLP